MAMKPEPEPIRPYDWALAMTMVAVPLAAIGIYWMASSKTMGPAGYCAISLAIAAGAAFLVWAWRTVVVLEGPSLAEAELGTRLAQLAVSMRTSAKLVEQISAELDARAATAERLKSEAETAEAIARLHAAETEAVRRMLDAQMEGQARRIRRDAIRIGIAGFMAGVAATILVTLLVHPLH